MSDPATLDRSTLPEVAPSRFSLKKMILAIVLLLLLGVGASFGFRYWQYASTHVSTDDAALSSDVIQVAPQVSGTVVKVYVKDNQPIKAGDLLVELDDATYRAAVDQAQANLDAAVAQAKGAGLSVELAAASGNAQVEQAKGVVGQAESGIAGAKADVTRSAASVENARAMAKSAEANIGTAEAGLMAAQANRQRADAAVKSAEAQVETAKANVSAAQAAVTAAQAAVEKADREARRYADLQGKGAVSAQTAENAATAAKTAAAQEEAAHRQVDAAQAQVEARTADLASARQQVEAADAAIAQAKAQLSASREQAGAAQAGVKQAEAASQGVLQTVQQAKARREQAVGQLSQANTAPRQVAVNRSAQAQANAKIEQARAALETAKIQLRYTHIYAPCDGIVSKKSVEGGALVQPGTPLMAVIPSNVLWVVANYKETQLTKIRAGERAEVTVDAFPGRKFSGRVDSVAAATGSTFALLPADNATGNFTKVVQRIPVKIILDPQQTDLDHLQAGMSVTAAIATR